MIGSLIRFGDVASNSGVFYFLDNYNDTTQNLPIFFKTLMASSIASLWRIFLMPIDTLKSIL